MAKAYEEAYHAECDRVWAHAGADGKLWDPDNREAGAYTVQDCYDTLVQGFAAGSESLAEARQAGKDDAIAAIEDLTISYQLVATNGEPFDV
jgi:hypothetical protein